MLLYTITIKKYKNKNEILSVSNYRFSNAIQLPIALTNRTQSCFKSLFQSLFSDRSFPSHLNTNNTLLTLIIINLLIPLIRKIIKLCLFYRFVL